MASLKVKFQPSDVANREGIVYYQFIHNHISRRWRSNYKLFENEWDTEKSTVRINHKSERLEYLLFIKERIKRDVERFKRILADISAKDNNFSADEVIEKFALISQEQSFFCFMRKSIERLKELGKQRTSETYTSALNSLKRFMHSEDINFDEFDSDLMESYESHLSELGLVPNSISFHMRILRAVYNRAAEKGITENNLPFRHVYTGIDKTVKRAVDIRFIKRIKKAVLPMNSKADYARDMFLLSFYFRGMSFIDMAYLRKSDIRHGYITYRRRKTGQQLTIKWTAQMSEILNKYPENQTEYILPIITSSSVPPNRQYKSKQYYINSGLKILATYIGLDMSLTLYCSRHSWASIAKSKGIPLGIISDGLGHNNELTTRIYLSSLDTSAVDKANALIMKLL